MPSNILRLITLRLAERMSKIAEEYNILGPEQFGFRAGRSTTDAIFVLSSIMQSAKRRDIPFVISILDISKVCTIWVGYMFAYLQALFKSRPMTQFGVLRCSIS